jgi:hypothetical protein
MSGSHIAVMRLLGSYLYVGIARRKCSIWSRRHSTGMGWEYKSIQSSTADFSKVYGYFGRQEADLASA